MWNTSNCAFKYVNKINNTSDCAPFSLCDISALSGVWSYRVFQLWHTKQRGGCNTSRTIEIRSSYLCDNMIWQILWYRLHCMPWTDQNGTSNHHSTLFARVCSRVSSCRDVRTNEMYLQVDTNTLVCLCVCIADTCVMCAGLSFINCGAPYSTRFCSIYVVIWYYLWWYASI